MCKCDFALLNDSFKQTKIDYASMVSTFSIEKKRLEFLLESIKNFDCSAKIRHFFNFPDYFVFPTITQEVSYFWIYFKLSSIFYFVGQSQTKQRKTRKK